MLGVGRALSGGDDLAPEPGEGPLVVEPEQRAGAVVEPDGAKAADHGARHPRRGLGHRQLQQPAEQPGRKDEAGEDDPAMGDVGEHLAGVEDPVVCQRPSHEQIARDDDKNASAIEGADAGEVA